MTTHESIPESIENIGLTFLEIDGKLDTLRQTIGHCLTTSELILAGHSNIESSTELINLLGQVSEISNKELDDKLTQENKNLESRLGDILMVGTNEAFIFENSMYPRRSTPSDLMSMIALTGVFQGLVSFDRMSLEDIDEVGATWSNPKPQERIEICLVLMPSKNLSLPYATTRKCLVPLRKLEGPIN